jgi:DNA-binding IclR family transcriptional regulator
MKENKGGGSVKSIDKAVKILNMIAEYKNGMRLKDIAGKMDLNLSSVHHIVSTLTKNKLIFKNPETGNYCLGIKIGELGNKYYSNIPDSRNLLTYLKKLHEEFDETVNLIIIEDGSYIIAESLPTSHSLRPVVFLDDKQIHASAWGKIILSSFEDDKLDKFLHNYDFIKYTEKTIDNIDEMKKEIKRIRETKISFDNEEYETGLYCIGIPVYGYRNRLIGSIVMLAPKTRLTAEKLNKIKETLLFTLKEIENDFGGN